MKKLLKLFMILVCLCPVVVMAQSHFSIDAYRDFLQTNQDLEPEGVSAIYPLQNSYYSNVTKAVDGANITFLDSVILKYNLTAGEQGLLNKNGLAVSERLNYDTFGFALHDIYIKDLPVLVTTDAVLHALHMSYDRILMDIEASILEKNLLEILEKLYTAYPALLAKYSGDDGLHAALSDVDLYIAIARSLLEESDFPCQSPYPNNSADICAAIVAEQYIDMPLFSVRNRHLDFSQFTVRGHYTKEFWDDYGEIRTLGAYFKAMMWLGRMDFLMTPPPENPFENPWQWWEIQRMDQGALWLIELVNMAGVQSLMRENDSIITFMVGESDNLTPDELSVVIAENNITLDAVADSVAWAGFQTLLKSNEQYGQKILSDVLMMDPYNPQPGALPVSYRLMGQRFIIDSYVFSNLVYDRIVYDSRKIWRPMPDPLDAMFALGNDNALPLLHDALDNFKYGTNLAALRYLVDSYDEDFWQQSLYNVWLNALRQLNPAAGLDNAPLFMQTTAWQQLKLNTQLSSWAQLRHDNLLYAKQSYTGGTGCSYPYSYIEPYPAFYHQIAAFADKAAAFFAAYDATNYYMNCIQEYFPRLKGVAEKLEIMAQKELNNEPFSAQEAEYLKKMLFVDGMSGAPPFSGWYADMYYVPEDAADGNYVIADVHTQPTDEEGNMVGRVLHVAVGKVNLGVFIANCPGKNYQPMAFVGPVMSYYEMITEDFDRKTDEEWTELVTSKTVPERPDWVNSFLADRSGEVLPEGRTLPGGIYTGINNGGGAIPGGYELAQNVPNPFNPATSISYTLPQDEHITLSVYNVLGRQVQVLFSGVQSAGKHKAEWNAVNSPSGVYFYRLQTGSGALVKKMLLVR